MRRPLFWTLLGYGLLTVAVFRPTPSELAGTSPAFHGIADDAMLLMWATSHVSRALFHDPLHLFDGGIFYPAHLTLAYSDHMIGQALVGLPIWLGTGNPLLEYNLLALASYVLGAAAAFAYARELGTSPVAAVVAGLVFAFTPYRFHSPLWLQALFTPFVPLALLAWARFLRTRSRAAWLGWVACWTLHGLMGLYLALYFAIVMSVLVLFACVAAPAPRDRRFTAALLAGPIVMGLLLAPTLAPYVALRMAQAHIRTFGIDTPLSFLLPGPGTLSAALLPTTGNGWFGPSFAVWILALAGAFGRSRQPSATTPVASFLRVANALGLVVTLAFVFTPIRLQQLVPGLDMVRATNRAFYLTLLFLGVFAADGVDRIRHAIAPQRRRVACVVILFVLLVDLGRPPRERIALPTRTTLPDAYRHLAALPGDPVVYDRGMGPAPLARAMYFQIFHGKRIPTGYTGFVNPAARYAMYRLYRFPAPEGLHLLRELGVTYVLDHVRDPATAAIAHDDAEAGITVAARFDREVLYRVEPGPPAPPLPAAVPADRGSWTATATVASDALAALRDGDPTTEWSAVVPGGTGSAAPSLTIDLATVRTVTGLRCDTPIDAALGVYLARISVSSDGEHFTPVPAAFEPESLEALYEKPASVRRWDVRFPPAPVRYVRLTNGELAFWGGRWTIGELEVLVPARDTSAAERDIWTVASLSK
jgi:hypothetical protein